MENPTLVSCSAFSPKLLIGCNFTPPLKNTLGFSRLTPRIVLRCSKISPSAQSQSLSSRRENAGETVVVKHRSKAFASNNSNGATASEVAGLSLEALEKRVEDPTFKKMVYRHLPEVMRTPGNFNMMVEEDPDYRQELQNMLNNLSGSGEWDERLMDTLQNFDMNSPEVKQQLDQLGLTPEEVFSKIMENPDVAMAYENPRVLAVLMKCSQNRQKIMNYQNDKEVIDVIEKLRELFPGLMN